MITADTLRIDFYLLKSPQATAVPQTVCRLVEKAYQQKIQLCLLTATEKESQFFDDLLWTFHEDGFIPHQIYDSAIPNKAPILISHTTVPEQSSVLINLTETTLDPIAAHLNRLIEVVCADPIKKQAARERYRQYRERGLQLFTHEI